MPFSTEAPEQAKKLKKDSGYRLWKLRNTETANEFELRRQVSEIRVFNLFSSFLPWTILWFFDIIETQNFSTVAFILVYSQNIGSSIKLRNSTIIIQKLQ